MAKKYSREFLEQIAEEMNKVMALTPAMEVSMPDDDTLLDTIKYNATGGGHVEDAIRVKDKFSDKAWDFFEEVGVWDGKKNAIIMPDAKASKKAVKEIEQEELELVEDVPTPKQAKGKTGTKTAPIEEPKDEEEIVEENEKEEEEVSTKKTATKKTAVKAGKATKLKETKKAPTKPASVPSKKVPVEKKKVVTKPVKATKAPKAEKKHIVTPRGTGVAALIRELITKHPEKSNADLSAIVRTKLKTETPSASVAWYRNQMKIAKKARKK
jgi:hypothetical protein